MSKALPLARRSSLLFVGSLVSTLCYALTIRAGLGLGPLYAIQDGIASLAGITIGQSVIVVGVALLGVAIAMRSWPGPGTLLLPFLGGFALDAMLPHLPAIHGMAMRLGVVVVASWVMALGGALIIRASVGVAALDAVMLGIHRLIGRPLAPIRLAMEATMLVAGWLLGGAVGVGTVITGLLIGPGLEFWLKVLANPRLERARGLAAVPDPS